MAGLKSSSRWSLLACGCVALAALSGCRNLDNAQVDVLESQLRQQEDYIYELEDYLLEYSEKLRQARIAQHQATTKSASGATASGEPHLMDDRPRAKSRPSTSKPKVIVAPPTAAPAVVAPSTTLPGPAAEPDEAALAPETLPAAPAAEPPTEPEPAAGSEPVDPTELDVPDVEIGPLSRALPWRESPSAPAGAELAQASTDGETLVIPDPVDYEADAEPAPGDPTEPALAEATGPALAAPLATAPLIAEPPTAEAAPAVQTAAAPLPPAGLRVRQLFRDQPAEEGDSPQRLLAVIEAVDAEGNAVPAKGAASVMVMVRDETGARKALDRWDFTAEEAAAAWQQSPLGNGLHVELPLERGELPAGELELWARVMPAEGEKLLTPGAHPFEVVQLVTVEDASAAAASVAENNSATEATEMVAPSEAVTAAEATPLMVATAASDHSPSVSPQAAVARAATWRRSNQPIDVAQNEGFASTTGAGRNGWKSRPIPASNTSDAKADAPKATARTDWQPFR
jgi:hypothetical protein